jgi:hypothetical protein
VVVDELFKRLQKQTEMDLLNQATQSALRSQNKLITSVVNPKLNLKKIRLASEVLWFFAALAIGLIMGYLFYELFLILLPDVKTELVKSFFTTETNFIYFLMAISVVGVYIARLTTWALKFTQE